MRWTILARVAAASALTVALTPAAFGCVFFDKAYKEGEEVCFRHRHFVCGEMGSWKSLPTCEKDTVTLPPPNGPQPPSGAPAEGTPPPPAANPPPK